MIGTNFSYEQYEKRRIEQHKAEGLRFVPEGDVPKVYCVVCANASDWNEIHNYIINENEIDGIPNRKVECTNLKKTCDRIGSYEISDAEAEQLRNHPKVIGVNIDEGYYEGTYKGKDIYPMSQPSSKINRYGGSVKISRDTSGSGFNSGDDSTWLSKTAAQIYRHQTLANPWKNSDDDTLITDDIEQYGDGTDVDVIVNDTAAWFGHIEFIKTGIGEPSNFSGVNALKSGFATSATTGVCGVLDVLLDGPYYIDPDFFEADASNRLTTRWDGTKVPVESVARAWWNNESTSYRSAKYVSTNITGGTATIGSQEDFGTISISSNYTRATHNGSNTALHTGYYDGSTATHGTPCMSQAYGKTHGWAYNANKWYISVIWATGSPGTSILYEILKVFHDNKPNRSSDNTKNPTICSNSWGSTVSFSDGEYAYWRTNGDGTGEETISVSGSSISPEWLDNFWSNNKHALWYPPTDSTMVEGAAMLDSGLIWLGSSGNNNNQQVKGDHPNYNNYVSSSSSRTLAQAEANGEMVNRVANPNCIGNVPNYNGGGVDVYRTFNVGALDDNTVSNGDGTYYERKVTYSNMGNAVDFYTIGDDSIGAQGGASNNFPRNDSTYRIDSNYNIVTSGGTLSLTSYDQRFGGTSSACPISSGLFATKAQYNRTWLWSDFKNWLENEVTDLSSDTEFTQGTEATTSNDSNWSSQTNLQGGPRKILWDAPTTAQVSTNGLTFRVDASNPSSYSGSGTAWNDLSGNNHNATLVNGPTYTTDDQGAIVFDGVNDYVNVSDTSVLPSGTNSFTYTIWVYIDTVSGNFGGTKKAAVLLSGNTVGTVEIGLFTTSNTAGPPEEFRMSRYGGGNTGTCAATVSMNTSAWYNITLVKDGASSQVIYQDGVQIGTGNHSNSFQGGYASVIAAAPSQSTYSGHLDGRIAEVAMYNRALSSAEVMEFYLATKDNHVTPIDNILMKGRLSMYLSGSGNSTLSFGITPLFAPIVKRSVVTQHVTNGLRMHLDADNYSGSGDWLDSTSNNHDATLFGNSITHTAASGSNGAYFNFTGFANHRMEVTDTNAGGGLNTLALMNGNNNFSINLWFNTTTFPPNAYYTNSPMLFNAGHRAFFILHGDSTDKDKICIHGYRNSSWGSEVESATLSTSTWYNLCFTYDSTNGSVLYMDGSQVATDSDTASWYNGFHWHGNTQIGGENEHGGNRAYNGKIAMVSLYEVTLTSDEVSANYLTFKSRYGH